MLTTLRAGAPAPAPPPPPPPVTAPPPAAAAARIPADLLRPARDTALHRSVPVRLDIPAIGVHTGLMRLGMTRDRTVEVPPLGAGVPAGWYEHSVTPGEVGASVLLGHVDSARYGPAVFYRLGDLRAGDAVSGRPAGGGTGRFPGTPVPLYPKDKVPARPGDGPLDPPGP